VAGLELRDPRNHDGFAVDVLDVDLRADRGRELAGAHRIEPVSEPDGVQTRDRREACPLVQAAARRRP
jgi:hypothetical protein